MKKTTNEIICPNCKKTFKVDETSFADIVKQVRDVEFEKDIEKEKKIYNEKRRKIYHEKKRKKILNQKRADDLFKD